jgi:hypothetical protein
MPVALSVGQRLVAPERPTWPAGNREPAAVRRALRGPPRRPRHRRPVRPDPAADPRGPRLRPFLRAAPAGHVTGEHRRIAPCAARARGWWLAPDRAGSSEADGDHPGGGGRGPRRDRQGHGGGRGNRSPAGERCAGGDGRRRGRPARARAARGSGELAGRRGWRPWPGQRGADARIAGDVGDRKRRWRQGAVERHHLLDPRDGRPARSGLWSVTVAAATCGQAEVAAKTAFLLGHRAGTEFLERKGLAGLLVGRSGASRRCGSWPAATGPSEEAACSPASR